VRKIKYKKGKKVQPTLLEYTGIHKYTQTEIQLFVYDTNDLAEFHEFEVSEIHKHVDFNKTNWLNVHGLNDNVVVKSIGDYLGIDNFMLSDILNTSKRTKLEEYHDTLNQLLSSNSIHEVISG
jgi:magnesium transporter